MYMYFGDVALFFSVSVDMALLLYDRSTKCTAHSQLPYVVAWSVLAMFIENELDGMNVLSLFQKSHKFE